MNIAPWLVAVTVAAGAPAAQPSISPATVTLAIVDATFVETLETIEKVTGIEIRVDESVSDDVRNRKVPHVNFVNARVDDALQFLAKFSGLVVEIVDEKTAVIKPRQ
ncbi:MAG TPA: hypothetical protein VFS91_07930 [Nitrobacter sp.]|nr:hypothetical protein [Nitrobacter sp.]